MGYFDAGIKKQNQKALTEVRVGHTIDYSFIQ